MKKHKTVPLTLFSVLFVLIHSFPFALSAEKTPYVSRLGQLITRTAEVYLPSQLVIGQNANFTVKAPAGELVKLYLSPQNTGFITTNGQVLGVGTTNQVLSGVVPENGILQLQLPIPDTPELNGQALFVDAVSGPAEHQLKRISLIQANGHKMDENKLAIVLPSKAGGPLVLPAMPGVSPQLFDQITTAVGAYTKGDDEAKKRLDDGTINRDSNIDKNPFANRGIIPGLGR
ncbi:MAG: hypothetical protein AAGI66_09195 [Cyanobacteria bacterium P01_H01_bin.74]